MDVAQGYQVERDIERLIEKRAAKGEVDPDTAEALWQSSVRRYQERVRQQNVAAWFAYFCSQAEAHRKLSQDYEARAEALCQEGAP